MSRLSVSRRVACLDAFCVYFVFAHLDVLNKIFDAPPAQLVMSQPFLDNPNTKPKERQDWLADGMKWVNNHIDELWEMGVGR